MNHIRVAIIASFIIWIVALFYGRALTQSPVFHFTPVQEKSVTQ